MNDFLDYSVFNRWRELLEENNSRKMGTPFIVPGIVIMYLARLMDLKRLTLRQLESELHKLSRIFRFHEISFIPIYRRIRKIIPEIVNNISGALAVIDSSGFKATLSEDYLGNKWHKIRVVWKTGCCYKHKQF